MSTSSLKNVNLQQLQRPKTLIVMHYKGRRISIPLFECYENITEYLYHQLHKFQVTVIENQKAKHKSDHKHSSLKDIACFMAREQEGNKLDLRMNILLSMSRLTQDEGKARLDLHVLDITSYYKFMEIQPYYSRREKQLIPEYQLYSILSTNANSTTYLGKRINDGRFYSIKFWRADNKLGQRQFNAMKIMHEQQAHVIHKNELELIPEIEEVRKTEGFYIFITEFCPGGTLREFLRSKIPEMECLHFMKQLIWGVYSLHEKYNLIHRALSLENLSVDFVGNLRIFSFEYSLPCYASNYLINSQVPQAYEENYIINDVMTPPQVTRSARYNHLVDYYGVGAVLYEIFHGEKPQTLKNKFKGEKEGIDIAIQSLMSDNLRDRELFANQIISELHEQKMKKISNSEERVCLENERLTLNRIQTGKSLNVEEYMKNGIQHEEVLKIMKPSYDDQIYYLNPIRGKKKSKSKEKSKSKSKDKEKDKAKSSKQKSRVSDGNKSNSTSKKSLNSNVSIKKQKSVTNPNKSIEMKKIEGKGKKMDSSQEKSKQKVKDKSKEKVKEKVKQKSRQKVRILEKTPKNLDDKVNMKQRSSVGLMMLKSPPKSKNPVRLEQPNYKTISRMGPH